MADHHQDDQDLYGDLSEAKAAIGNDSTSRKRVKLLAPSDKSESAQVLALQKQVEALKKENEILRRNTGTLYRTAKSEIERKNAEIESLMKQLEAANG